MGRHHHFDDGRHWSRPHRSSQAHVGEADSAARGAEPAEAVATPAAAAASAASAPAGSASAPSVGLGVPRKVPSDAVDYAIPALEIIGFDFLVNRLNYHFGSEKEDYAVTAESMPPGRSHPERPTYPTSISPRRSCVVPRGHLDSAIRRATASRSSTAGP